MSKTFSFHPDENHSLEFKATGDKERVYPKNETFEF